MRRASSVLAIAVVTAGLVPALLTGAGAAAAAATAGGWGSAREVPGTAVLNAGGNAEIYAMSCAAAGSCTAGGYYTDASDHGQAFVVTETKGRWQKATEVPGMAALNKGYATVSSLSCAAAGSCAAGGYYRDGSGHTQAFVVTETKGRWQKATEVPGTAALNAGGFAEIESVSCAAPGSCAAAGYYVDGSDHGQAFVVTETKGRWSKAIEVPGTAALNVGGNALVYSVSCAAVGSCAAGGYFQDGSGHFHPFVVTETRGRWRKAAEVRGVARGNGTVISLSCAAVGSCVAGGNYRDSSGELQVFVVTEARGRWGRAVEAPGTATLNAGGGAEINSVSCASTGNCSAGGSYTDSSGRTQAFVVSEIRGRWGKAEEVPGTATLNAGGNAAIASVSCAAARSCAAGGNYEDGSGNDQVFVVTDTNGRWRTAIEVPGTATLNAGGFADIASVSCAAAGSCAAGGYYDAGSGHDQAFVVTSS